jgi:hypothetical protein
MISQVSPLPTIGEMYAGTLDHNRSDRLPTTVATESALEAYFLPEPEIAKDDAVKACMAAVCLWAAVTDNQLPSDHAAVGGYLTRKYQFIFVGSETDLQSRHSRTAP